MMWALLFVLFGLLGYCHYRLCLGMSEELRRRITHVSEKSVNKLDPAA
jgi:hypothetical protein